MNVPWNLLLSVTLAAAWSPASAQQAAAFPVTIDGYEELASAMAISVPAVKSLLLRARTGMIDIAAARDTPCAAIRDELICAADRSAARNGYFELLAQPAKTIPNTPSDAIAKTNRMPTFRSAITHLII